jgi:hypothetical protein
MSANAGTWFYRDPEPVAYLISERVNGTFWQARVIEFYWTTARTEAPFEATGTAQDGTQVTITWQPGGWLRLASAGNFDAEHLIFAISRRILAIPASLSYKDANGMTYTEWHIDGGKSRWSEIQGNPSFAEPQRL